MPQSIFSVGSRVRCTVTITVSGTPTDPTGTGLTFKWAVDGGTVTTYTLGGAEIQTTGTGVFYVDIDMASSGRVIYQWKATETVFGAVEKAFMVRRQRIS